MTPSSSPSFKPTSLPESPDPISAVAIPRLTRTKVVSNVVLAVMAVIFFVPLLWVLLASVDKEASWHITMPQFTLDNFKFALQSYGRKALLNGLLISVIATAVGTVPAVLGAYALSRFRVPLKEQMVLAILFLSGVPMTVIIIPVFQIFAQRGWLTITPTAMFLGVTTLPFELYIIKNFIDAIPAEVEEAAQMEGAGTLTVLRRIIIPLSLPGITSAAIFAFVNAWGAFLIPLVLITDSNQLPGPVAIYGFITANAVQYGNIAAYSVAYSLPVVILYLALGRLLSGGFVLGGAVK